MEGVLRAIRAAFTKELTFKVIALVVAASVASITLMYVVSGQEVFKSDYGSIVSMAESLKVFVLKKSLYIFAFSLILMICGVVVLSVLYSHRVAGPLYRVKSVAREISKGRLNVSVKFRKTDLIHPLADSINSMAQSYRERLSGLESLTKQMRLQLQALEGAIRAADAQRVRDLSLSLEEKSREIEDILKEIKL